MRIEDRDIPENAVAVFPPEKRCADSLGLVAEDRVICRPLEGAQWAGRLHRRPPQYDYALVGGGVGWFGPKPEIGYPGVPGFLGMFFVAGLIEHPGPRHSGWAKVQLTQAGEFLFSVWRRDRDRAREQFYAETAELDQERSEPDPLV